MRIACPNCSAAYEVPDALLATGPRLLRCARCGTQFTAPGATPAPTAPAAEPPRPAPPPEAATPPGPPPAPQPAPARPPPPEPSRPEPSTPEPPPPDPPRETATLARDRPLPTRGPTRHSPIDAPPTAEAEEPPAEPARGQLAAAWLGSFALLGALVFAALHWRAEIAAAWPPAARLYAALGLG